MMNILGDRLLTENSRDGSLAPLGRKAICDSVIGSPSSLSMMMWPTLPLSEAGYAQMEPLSSSVARLRMKLESLAFIERLGALPPLS